MVQSRIKPFQQQQAESARRQSQQHIFRRNQIVGLVLVAALICLWTLWHAHPGWVFPAGWWRL